MIDSLTIFSKAGLVLYHHDVQSSRTATSAPSAAAAVSQQVPAQTIDTINAFISNTLLDHNAYDRVKKITRTTIGTTVVEWESMSTVLTKQHQQATAGGSSSDSNGSDEIKRDWIAVVTYPEVLIRTGGGGGHQQSMWIRHFLRTVLREYGLYYDAVANKANNAPMNGGRVQAMKMMVPDAAPFDGTCRAVLRRSEKMGRRGVGGTGGGGGGVSESFAEGADHAEDDDLEDAENDDGNGNQCDIEEETDEGDDARARARAALKNRNRRGSATTANREQQPKKGKEERVWHDGKGKMTKSALKQLDRSRGVGAGEVNGIDAAIADDSAALAEARAAYLPSSEEVPAWEEEDVLLDDDDDDDSTSNGSGGGWGSSLKGLFEQMSGNKVLTKEDLNDPLEEMKRMLTSKNVANEVAAEICEGVRDKLVGKRMNSFGRVKTAIRHALEAAIEKILMPAHGRDVDVLHSVVSKRERGSGIGALFGSSSKSNRPYTIVMVGINGVGKSTSLAKIAYYLKSNGCSPLLAACDTFRSGAVEQLNVHAKCLDVPLYHKGYAKDPSAVAKAAINHAGEEGNDVVLVDTAGRMQNNIPLMKALSKLVVENQPDLVLFVCEALVGNDGMDQLHMFNKALRTGGHSRQIDGIVLTKFDTVSDKVGAALTMTHITGAPVVFVGTGQKYNHLKKLSVQSVIKSLFS